jgi:hypothetical protein
MWVSAIEKREPTWPSRRDVRHQFVGSHNVGTFELPYPYRERMNGKQDEGKNPENIFLFPFQKSS